MWVGIERVTDMLYTVVGIGPIRIVNQVVPSSALDIATDPETMELRIPEEILNPLPLSDPPPSSSNNTESIILLS